MLEHNYQCIILGAGRSKQLTQNPALVNIDQDQCTLDWLLKTVGANACSSIFVGGYTFDTIAQKYPQLRFVCNAQWAKTGCETSLYLSQFDPKLPAFICYGDILVRSALVELVLKVAEADDSDGVITLDSHTQLLDTKENYECFEGTLKGQCRNYPFVGCVYLKPKALGLLQQQQCFRKNGQNYRLSDLIHLCQDKLRLTCVDAHGLWAEILRPIDITKFILTTKSETLQTLQRHITQARMLDQVHFSVKEWREQSSSLVSCILQKFRHQPLVVRSSSLQEDNFTQANAGKFESILNVQPEAAVIKAAVDTVIQSYGTPKEADQVLVQPMLPNVKLSGVVFTRSLQHSAPYYIVNYDGTSTESVTSGQSTQDVTFYHWKHAPIPSHAPDFYPRLQAAIQEIEHLTQWDALDIEFAVTQQNELYLFQVRPLVARHLQEISDEQLQQCLDEAAERFDSLQIPQEAIAGQHTIFGVMPDWNPAEMIGTKPNALAASLYRTLITDSIWAQQRAEFGYKDVRPYPLMVSFAGHPYIDVRASIHSFIPKSVPTETTGKLVTFFVNRLKQHPEWHDKLEFKVMPTCDTCDFDERWHALLTQDAGLSVAEYQQYRSALHEITHAALIQCEAYYKAIKAIEERFARIKASQQADSDKIYTLVETAKIGTLNFSHLARCGFIARSLLQAYEAQGIITKEESQSLVDAIQTIAGQFFKDTQAAIAGKGSKQACLDIYGHLRPGTYDITSPTYRSDPEKYLFVKSTVELSQRSKAAFSYTKLEAALQKDWGISLTAFRQFLQCAIAGREYSKFIFTRYISLILDLIQAIGARYGFSPQELEHVPITVFQQLRGGIDASKTLKALLQTTIEQGALDYCFAQAIELPPLITNKSDFYAFFVPKTLPNFIGNQKAEAPLVYLKNSDQMDGAALRDKIVLIEKADPGFDWILNYAIAGLITAYGGPNSHMAIRSAECHLPAAIGIGEALFDSLKTAQLVHLDCANHTLKRIR